MYYARPADPIVGRIPVGLQNTFPLTQKLLWAVPTSTQAEIEDRFSPGFTVLPQIRLVIRSAFVFDVSPVGQMRLLYVGLHMLVMTAGAFEQSFTDTVFPPPGWAVVNADSGTRRWQRLDIGTRTPPG